MSPINDATYLSTDLTAVTSLGYCIDIGATGVELGIHIGDFSCNELSAHINHTIICSYLASVGMSRLAVQIAFFRARILQHNQMLLALTFDNVQ